MAGWRNVSPKAIRVAHFILLVVTLSYGARFVTPVGMGRSPVYEYVTTDHTPLWFWGGVILSSCTAAFISEGLAIRWSLKIAMWVSLCAHALLGAIFFTLGLAGLWLTMEIQFSGDYGPWNWMEFIGGLNRPAQFWLVAYMHSIFVRRTNVAGKVWL